VKRFSVASSNWAFVAIAVSVLLRFFYAGRVELLPEETYYWNYSQHLDIGYLDHPPMVAWLIRLGTVVFGNCEFGVRIGALICGAIAAIFAFRLSRNLFGEAGALMAVVLMATLPFFFLAGMLMTPDAPLTAAWISAAYFLERALIGGKSRAWWGAGLCLGLGMLSKYTIALLGLSAFVFILIDARARSWLRRPEPYGAALLALAVFSPVIAWNAQHEWASFAFQTSRRLAESPRFSLHLLIASVIVLLTPTGAVAAVKLLAARKSALGESDAPAEKLRVRRFLRMIMLVPFAVFAMFSLRHPVKLDWTGAPWVGFVPALAFGIVSAKSGWQSVAWPPTFTALLLLYAVGLFYLAFGIAGVGYSAHIELIPVGWRDFGSQIHAIALKAGATEQRDPLVVGMDRYAIASELTFYAPDIPKAVAETTSGHLFGQVGLMYERWFPIAGLAGRTLLLVAWNPQDLSAQEVTSAADRLDPIHEGTLTRGGRVIRHYYYRVAHGYRVH
jgi:dolichol-phosphate mannosyltransferase